MLKLILLLLIPSISFAANIELSTTTNNLGVGTVAQSGNKLDVNGNVRATNFTGPGTGLTGINSSSINWSNVNGLNPINSGGINWSNVNGTATINNSGVNWSNINAGSSINNGAVNWSNINGAGKINSGGINWTNANLFASGPTGNFGVGTGNPGTLLDVAGTGRFTGFQLSTGPSASYVLTSNSVGVGTWMPVVSGGSGTVSSGTADRVAIYDSAGTTIVSSSVITDDNTNIGIGSTAPGTKLDVNGTVRATTLQAGSGTGTISADANGNIGIGTSSASNMISLGSTGQVQILTGGNVGIGTTAPPQKLYVAGTGEFQGFKMNSGASAGYVLTSSSVGVGTWMPNTASGSGTVNSGTISRAAVYASAGTTVSSSTKIFDDGTNVGIGTIAPRTAVELGVQAMNIVGANVGIGSITPGQALDVNGAIRTTGSGDSYFGSNVGIGSTTPGVALDLGTGALRVGIGTVTSGTILCVKSIANSRATMGYCTGSLTNSICGTCN